MKTYCRLFPMGLFVLALIAAAPVSVAETRVTLEPPFQTVDAGLTAELEGQVLEGEGETPVSGASVRIFVFAGPNAGLQDTVVTNSQGRFDFSYIGNTPGLDRIEAAFAGTPPESIASTPSSESVSPAVVATAEVEWVADEPKAPDCNTVVASPRLIWPPNHKFRDVTLHGPDPVDGVDAEVTVTHVYQDEPVNDLGDGNFEPDAEISGQGQTVAVRAERSGLLDGRLYFIGFTAELPAGGACQGEAALGVPHDRRQNNLPQDSGERYDSLTGEDLDDD